MITIISTKKLRKLREEIERLRGQSYAAMLETRRNYATASKDIEALLKENHDLGNEIDSLNRRLNKATSDCNRLKKKLKAFEYATQRK